jgi:two-component system response regulator FixJ
MVHIVEDDDGLRRSLLWLMGSNGIPSTGYGSATAFLDSAQVKGPSCLLLDMHLPVMSGLEMLRQMTHRPELSMPVIVMTATGVVGEAVECIKLGARDFLEKPVDPVLLLAMVNTELARDALARAKSSQQATARELLEKLTEREREILQLLCAGNSTKQMAAKLNISAKTVSIHRWHLMKKMQVGSATEAVHLAYSAQAA